MSEIHGDGPEPRAPSQQIEHLLGELRPKLHRYCARMTGSTIDGEDLVQETMVKAITSQGTTLITNAEAWLFAIAHHSALDFLRRRVREAARFSCEDLDSIAAPRSQLEDRQIAEVSLRTFMQLPATQRSSVILSDVLGHSLQEISQIVGNSVPAIKSALQRGRGRLRSLAEALDSAPCPELNATDRARLTTYVAHFNAHDFDAVRALLAEDVQLEIVGRTRLDGKKNVTVYFSNYASRPHWRFTAGLIDAQPAMLVHDGDDSEFPVKYFVLLRWTGDRIVDIRDFVFARYVMDAAQVAFMT